MDVVKNECGQELTTTSTKSSNSITSSINGVSFSNGAKTGLFTHWCNHTVLLLANLAQFFFLQILSGSFCKWIWFLIHAVCWYEYTIASTSRNFLHFDNVLKRILSSYPCSRLDDLVHQSDWNRGPETRRIGWVLVNRDFSKSDLDYRKSLNRDFSKSDFDYRKRHLL